MDSREDLSAAVEQRSRYILEMGITDWWTSGCIYPCEMAYLLGYFDVLGIRNAIESGRQEGFSTYILGRWAKDTGNRVYSFDYEVDPAVAAACRRRLDGLPVEQLVGDAWFLMAPTVERASGPTAVLVDGPKHWSAVSLLCAAAGWDKVRLIASHNLGWGTPTRQFMQSIAAVPIGYNDRIPAMPAWSELRRRELARVAQLGLPVGDSSRTTLAAIPIEPADRRRIAGAWHPSFRLYPPSLVRWCWRSGNDRLLARCRWLSSRLLGAENDPEQPAEDGARAAAQ